MVAYRFKSQEQMARKLRFENYSTVLSATEIDCKSVAHIRCMSIVLLSVAALKCVQTAESFARQSLRLPSMHVHQRQTCENRAIDLLRVSICGDGREKEDFWGNKFWWSFHFVGLDCVHFFSPASNIFVLRPLPFFLLIPLVFFLSCSLFINHKALFTIKETWLASWGDLWQRRQKGNENRSRGGKKFAWEWRKKEKFLNHFLIWKARAEQTAMAV